jgi:hypothetical protein
MGIEVYLDESGDLGWALNDPYRHKGSSRYFTLAYAIIPVEDIKHVKRFVRKFLKERGAKNEVKGAKIRTGQAKSLAREMNNLRERLPSVFIGAVTVHKINVISILQDTGNSDILYNHMVKEGICSNLPDSEFINIIPDQRSVPRGSQNSCSDLIKEEVWLKQQRNININYTPRESHLNEGLMFIDWVANFVWRHYENGYSAPYQILAPLLSEQKLFFPTT